MSVKQKYAIERLLEKIQINKLQFSPFNYFSFFKPIASSHKSNAAIALRDVIFGYKDKSILSEYSEVLRDVNQFESNKTSLSAIYNELVKVKLISEVKPKNETVDYSDEEVISMRSLPLY